MKKMTFNIEILTDEDLEKALIRLEQIWDSRPEDPDWEERLDLTEKIIVYEDEHFKIPKLTVPDVLDKFVSYHKKNAAWGSLHIVLDDNNFDNDSVLLCVQHAHEQEDFEGEELAQYLVVMSKTQRKKIARLA